MVRTFQPTTATAAVAGLPHVFQPTAASGFDAIVRLELFGREPGCWTLLIRDGACRVLSGRGIEPTVTVTCDSDRWLEIARGERTLGELLDAAGCQVTGDLVFALRFDALFPVH